MIAKQSSILMPDDGRFFIAIKPKSPRDEPDSERTDIDLGILLFSLNMYLDNNGVPYEAHLEEFDRDIHD